MHTVALSLLVLISYILIYSLSLLSPAMSFRLPSNVHKLRALSHHRISAPSILPRWMVPATRLASSMKVTGVNTEIGAAVMLKNGRSGVISAGVKSGWYSVKFADTNEVIDHYDTRLAYYELSFICKTYKSSAGQEGALVGVCCEQRLKPGKLRS